MVMCLFWGFFVLNSQGICASHASAIYNLYQKACGGDDFYHPKEKECKKARQLFGEMMQQDPDMSSFQGEKWQSLGFQVVGVQENSRQYKAVIEKGIKKGRGFYLFSDPNDSQTALMCPHSMKDLKTGAIGLQMMQIGNFVCAAFNTVPRYTSKDHDTQQQDMAHVKQTYFLAFTKAFADTFPNGRLVQIHGFAKKKGPQQPGKEQMSFSVTAVPSCSPEFSHLLRVCASRPISISPSIHWISEN
jgi:hypothetical protein